MPECKNVDTQHNSTSHRYSSRLCLHVDDDGYMPLHRLCTITRMDESNEIQVLKYLIEKCPQAVRHTNNKGCLPLHLVQNGSPEFCSILIEAYPGSERIADAKGALPLHYACHNNSIATIEYLHKLYPDAINHVDADGCYPFHDAIIGMGFRNDPAIAVEAVKFLFKLNPDAVNHTTTNTFSYAYPIQLAIEYLVVYRIHAAAKEIVKFLCDSNVKLQKTSDGESLLHRVCTFNDDGQHLPSDMNAKDQHSYLLAVLEVVKAIYDAHPEAIEDNGMIELLDENHFSPFLNSQLAYARQAKDHRQMMTPDDNGRLPLHRALANNVTLGSIKLLVKGNPSAIRIIDDSGALPLHVACQYHDSASVVQHLLDLNLRTLRAVDYDNNTALHLACSGAKYDIIALLLESNNAVPASKQNGHKKLPIELLWESSVVDRDSIEYTGSVYRVLKAYPEMITNCNMNTKQQSKAGECLSQYGKKRKYINA